MIIVYRNQNAHCKIQTDEANGTYLSHQSESYRHIRLCHHTKPRHLRSLQN